MNTRRRDQRGNHAYKIIIHVSKDEYSRRVSIPWISQGSCTCCDDRRDNRIDDLNRRLRAFELLRRDLIQRHVIEDDGTISKVDETLLSQ